LDGAISRKQRAIAVRDASHKLIFWAKPLQMGFRRGESICLSVIPLYMAERIPHTHVPD
jgi:hypothetical protein